MESEAEIFEYLNKKMPTLEETYNGVVSAIMKEYGIERSEIIDMLILQSADYIKEVDGK